MLRYRGLLSHVVSRLEEHYGLRINHNDYVITYEAYASNMAPSVMVVPR